MKEFGPTPLSICRLVLERASFKNFDNEISNEILKVVSKNQQISLSLFSNNKHVLVQILYILYNLRHEKISTGL